MNNLVFVLGGGAIGMALAVHLKQHNRDILLVRTSRDNILRETVTICMEDKQDEIVKTQVDMVSLDGLEILDGIVVVATKSYANKMIAEKISTKTESPLVVMQNGLGVEQPFLDAGFSEIYRCILFSTSQTMGEYCIRFKPVTSSPIGIIRGNEVSLRKIVDTLHTPDFQFSVELNIQEKIWQKAILNSVFNSICPLLEIDNGIFYRNNKVSQLALVIIEECVSVASAIGISLKSDQIYRKMLTISKASESQLISTLVDIQHNRETEIDSLNLEIARIAENQVPKIDIEKTLLLGKLIHLKSEISRNTT